MLARDIMTRDPVVASPTTPVADVVEVFAGEGFRHLPVVDDDDELVGVVSDRDVRVFSVAQLLVDGGTAKARMRMPVVEIMTGAPLSVEPDDDVDDVIDLMVENKVGAVPVVDPDGKVVGIISTIDVLVAAQGRLR